MEIFQINWLKLFYVTKIPPFESGSGSSCIRILFALWNPAAERDPFIVKF